MLIFFFKKYTQILVLRLDFGYERKERWYVTEEEAYIELIQARGDFENFVTEMAKNELYEHKVGYAWKLEYGLENGFKYYIIFFDGSQISDDAMISNKIGEHWKNITKEHNGIYYNLNANKEYYKKYNTELGIGMIHRCEAERINVLKCIVIGLLSIKTDYIQEFIYSNDSFFTSKKRN